ncbi:GtrA family protein, partial [Mesorhizobium sp. M4B.F.Ca.ET.200.01.1.1]
MGTAETGVATWKSDLILALLAALLALAIDAWTGFGQLTDPGGDYDNMLRLVEVRDLLAGQGWFDLHQYRMGLEGGFVMHWSRLVDAPIAAI